MKLSGNPMVLLGAMKEEYEALTSLITVTRQYRYAAMEVSEGMLENRSCVAVLSGVGKVAAAATAQYLIQHYQPAAVLFTGVGGALNPAYEIGDVVLATDCVQHDMDGRGLGFPRGVIPYSDSRFLQSDEQLLKLAMDTPLSHTVHVGRILTGDQFIQNKHHPELAYLTEELQGDVVDMEGAAVAWVCMQHQVPFLLIRTVSDKANHEAPESFEAFLPEVVSNSTAVILHVLKQYPC